MKDEVRQYRFSVVRELLALGVPAEKIEYVIAKTGLDQILDDPELAGDQMQEPAKNAALKILVVAACDGSPAFAIFAGGRPS